MWQIQNACQALRVLSTPEPAHNLKFIVFFLATQNHRLAALTNSPPGFVPDLLIPRPMQIALFPGKLGTFSWVSPTARPAGGACVPLSVRRGLGYIMAETTSRTYRQCVYDQLIHDYSHFTQAIVLYSQCNLLLLFLLSLCPNSKLAIPYHHATRRFTGPSPRLQPGLV